MHRLDEKRRSLLPRVLRPLAMVRGSLYKMRRRCGNPRCKCARGYPHASWYLSGREGGRTKLIYIGRVVPEWLARRVGRYQRHQKTLAAIRKIDAGISKCLNELRDGKVQSYEEAHEERQ